MGDQPRVVTIIQARMGSTRLPGKILKPLQGRPMLEHIIERVQRATRVDAVVLATSTSSLDDQVAETFASHPDVIVSRGSEDDVLSRFEGAATAADPDVVVRITGDCPLIEPAVIDRAVSLFLDNQPTLAYVSNTVTRTYPRGLDVEVFSRATLREIHAQATAAYQREHVTPFVWQQPERFPQEQLTHPVDFSHHRWTVDTSEDFALIEKIYDALYPTHPTFGFQDILDLLDAHPEWVAINADIVQKNLSSQTS